jgi:phosphohistidine phosphatase
MLLCFLRHAEAEPVAGSDSQRQLTPKGVEQCEKAAKFCLRNGLLPEVILHSPIVRAQQTARNFAKKIGTGELLECPWLACGMVPDKAAENLRDFLRHEMVFLVGHEPDFSSTISWLLGTTGNFAVRVRKASLTAVDTSSLSPGSGRLEFSLPVRLM